MRELDLSEIKLKPEYYVEIINVASSNRKPRRSYLVNDQILDTKIRRHSDYLSSNSYHKIIIEAIQVGLSSPWFHGLAEKTRIGFKKQSLYFFGWLKNFDSERCGDNRYKCLDDYESYRIGNIGLKYSGANSIKRLLNVGLEEGNFSHDASLFLRQLVRLTKKIKTPERKSHTMTEWFDIPWLRNILGEKKYLQLESPALLLKSFRIAVSVSLSLMLEARKQWQENDINELPRLDNPRWWAYQNPARLNTIGNFDENGDAADALTNLLWIDYVIPKQEDELRSKVASKKHFLFPTTFRYWQMPLIFNSNYIHKYSVIEQRLASWLAACESIQPSDIPKLKTSDYASEYNAKGKLILLQCTYYKGRSGNYKQPSILMATDCWTKTFKNYMELIPHKGRLFSDDVLKGISIPNLGDNAKNNSEFNFIFRLWKSKMFQSAFSKEILKVDASSLFVDAILSLEHGSKSYGSYRLSIGEYESNAVNPLPTFFFKLTHIKTTAIHAESDIYRESDLINHHSHTSVTERNYYLTDANKEWINQCGRITRLVLNDLQNVIYQPSLNKIQEAVKNFELKTRVISATGSNDADILTKKYGHLEPSIDTEDIVVIDSIDSAIYFIHFLNQAEKISSKLTKIRPDYVEITLLTKIEWMTRTLHRMSSAKRALDEYPKYEKYLPPLFDHLFETTQ